MVDRGTGIVRIRLFRILELLSSNITFSYPFCNVSLELKEYSLARAFASLISFSNSTGTLSLDLAFQNNRFAIQNVRQIQKTTASCRPSEIVGSCCSGKPFICIQKSVVKLASFISEMLISLTIDLAKVEWMLLDRMIEYIL